jgi:hypothetical protein
MNFSKSVKLLLSFSLLCSFYLSNQTFTESDYIEAQKVKNGETVITTEETAVEGPEARTAKKSLDSINDKEAEEIAKKNQSFKIKKKVMSERQATQSLDINENDLKAKKDQSLKIKKKVMSERQATQSLDINGYDLKAKEYHLNKKVITKRQATQSLMGETKLELENTTRDCAEGEFTCNDGSCIPGSWECDVYWCDCPGSDCEDEADCGGDTGGSPECDDCVYDFTNYGSECCDTAADAFGIDCATLEANFGDSK